MSNYCACSGGDEEYSIELNQQGPPGPQGPVGPEGFSPSISVNTNTDAAYILTVTNKEGSFNTPNLYGVLEKLNADMSNLPNPVFLNGVILSQDENGVPSIELDTSKAIVDTDGNLVFSASATDEEGTESFNYEVVVNPKDQRLELHDNEGNVKIVATTDYIPTINVATTTTAGIVKPDGNTITVSNDGTISAVQQDLSNLATKQELTSLETTLSADIAALDADKLASANIIAGANISIDRNGNNLTINSTGGGGGSGDVTAAGDNRFTGDNTFTGKVNIAGGALTVEGLATLNQATAQYLNAVSITSSGEINATSIKANGLRSDDIQTTENKKYLTEVDVDNQTIQIVNGKLHANLDELGNEVNDLSNRVTTLQISKQDTLTAGENITIVGNVISATGGGGGGEGGAAIDDSVTSTVSTWSSSKINSEITTVANEVVQTQGDVASLDEQLSTAVDTINSTKNNNIFDISKFTVVGTPNITDDGIASGFSTNNYLITQLIESPNNSIDLKFQVKINSVASKENAIIGNYLATSTFAGVAVSVSSNNNLRIYLTSEHGIEGDILGKTYSNIILNANESYNFNIIWDGSTYIIKYKLVNSSDWVIIDTIISSVPVGPAKLSIGNRGNKTVPFTVGSIDLKHISITVDDEVVFNGLMESTKPIYDKITSTSTTLSTFQTDTDNNFSAVNSALNEKANLSDLAGYVTLTKYNELLARVVALETEINGGNA